MIHRNHTMLRAATMFMLVVTFCLFSVSSWGVTQGSAGVNTTQPEKLTLTAGKSIVLESPVVAKRISIAAPDIADALVLSPKQIYVTGKLPGCTNLTIWNEADQVSRVFEVEVLPDIARLKVRLHETFPQEENVKVTANHDSITLAGTVSSMTNLSQIVTLAQSFVPADKGDKDGKQKVVNLLEVGGVHQVMLEVRVSEMSRSLIRKLGFNFAFISASGRQLGLSLLDNLTRLPSQGGFPADPLNVSDNINSVLQFLGNGATWTVFIDALKEEGLLKVLAEPSLITLSGRPANFLAGGEFPIPVPQPSAGGSVITVQYKTFGVGLNFTPTVLSNGKINMQVAPEVSELDFSQAISLQGFIIPSLTTRRVSTTVELGDGQSFAIAGLLKDEVREDIRKFPVLGDIPILGALFRSTSFQKNQTELVVIVTPHLVKPLDMAKQTLPTDSLAEPDDFEWYLMGNLEGKGKLTSAIPPRQSLDRRGGLEGDFGHMVP